VYLLVLVGVDIVLRCLKVQSLVQTKREVMLHNEVQSEIALEMGIYVHRHKRTEHVKMRYAVRFIPHGQFWCHFEEVAKARMKLCCSV
jgi:hypothetical protein